MRSGKKHDPFIRAADDLATFDLAGQTAVLRDVVVRLDGVLRQIARVRAGEIRIVALGQCGSMKSTMLRLLLGSDVLSVGPGAVTVAATELRLTQDGTAEAPTVRVVTLTEEAARRRSCALLDLTEDDPRTLAELQKVPHPNQKLVTALIEAADLLGYGAAYDLDTYRDKGGALTFDAAGVGTELVARVVVELPVDRQAWDLGWAGDRTVVVVDTPGTRMGGPLEDVIIKEMQDRAHLALLTMACAAGTAFTAPPAPPGAHPVLVATKLDAVDNPANVNELRTLDGAVVSNLRELSRNGHQAQVVAVSGPWAVGDQEAWTRFDPDNSAVWQTAEIKRERWREALRTVAEPGALHDAVAEALQDGGVARLQRTITKLATDDPARLDDEEIDRLLAEGLTLVDASLAELPDPGELEALAAKLRDRAYGDPAPIAGLREIASQVAVDLVYGSPMWRLVRQSFQHRQGQWLAPVADVKTALEGFDFRDLAADAINDTREQLNDELAAWQRGYNTPGLGTATWRPSSAPDEATSAQAADQYAALSDQLVDRVVTGGAEDDPSAKWLTFRKVARTRDELTKFLERLLLALFESTAIKARNDLIEHFKHSKDDVDESDLSLVFDDIRRNLLKLADARSDSAD
jgi:hypothetical protein